MSEPALSRIKGIGPARLKAFHEAGIDTVRDLLACLPREYRDLSDIHPLSTLSAGEEAAVRVRVAGGVSMHRAGKLVIVKARVADESESMAAVWYNQPWLRDTLVPGRELLLYGKVEARFGELQLVSPAFESGEGLKPVYRPLPGIPQKTLVQAIQSALALQDGQWDEPLPESLRRRHGLCERNYAVLNAHRPISREALAAARRRLAFEELLLFQVGLWLMRGQKREGVTIDAPDALGDEFWQTLPFTPTNAQRRVLKEVLADLRAPHPMARLVQGDVGSGKTMVAAAGIYFAVKNGLQAALMAPTEILAEQHYHTLAPLLEKLGVRCALLTASTKAKTRRSILEQLAAGEIDLAIGTHALLSPDISYQNLGLVVTDEQHRFGVNQRAALGAKGENPHLLVMSATPIPRTLALMIYGDLDVSVIDELPPGRRSIETYAVPSSYHERIYAFLEKQLAEGRQAYIVCPMVEENGELPDERKAVTAYAEKLQKEVLPNRTVRFLHGKMKAKEKETVMRAFAAGEIDVLVSTTVVEVGVDVPNASVMLIENAECFGLSQLHQLRGRVGRGPWQSYCILVSDNRGEDNITRLDAMRRTQSGFALAEEDLKLRGPGDFFGARQHGLPTLRVADFACDMELLYEAQGAAEALLALDPRLEGHPALHARVRELFDLNAEALN